MHSTQKITKLKKITIVSYLLACIPIAFIYLFLRDIPLLSSLFIEYVNSGTSIFLPFLTSSTIVFQFTTGHLIDIIIIFNIVNFLERGGYHYYVKVCLKKNYLELYPETNFLEFYETREESPLNSDLLLPLKSNSGKIVNEDSDENNFDKMSRININHFNNKYGYYSCLPKMKHNQFNSLGNNRKKKTLFNNFYTFFLYYSTEDYHLPSKNNCLFPNSSQNFYKEEGR